MPPAKTAKKSKAKVRPKTIQDVMSTKLMKSVMDRHKPIEGIVDQLTKNWEYDLEKRKPSPAMSEEGVFVGTDLDACTFLMAIAEREAVMVMPHYNSRRPVSIKDSQWNTSKMNRHGKVSGLTANKEMFSFSLRMLDMSIVDEAKDKVGAFRNFMLTDFDGDWWPGWSHLIWKPDAKENDFLMKNKLWSDGSVSFKHFVAPQRWISLYGQHYFALKAALVRIKDETDWLKKEIDSMLEQGAKWPASVNDEAGYQQRPESAGEVTKLATARIKVDGYIFEVDLPSFEKEYHDQSGYIILDGSAEALTSRLVAMYQKRKNLIYSVTPKLRFIARCIELAWVNRLKSDAIENDPNKTFPGYIKNCKWEAFKPKRTEWMRLALGQRKVGEEGYAIRFRIKSKTEEVNPLTILAKDEIVPAK